MSAFVQGAGIFYALLFMLGLVVIVFFCTISFGLKRALQVTAITAVVIVLFCSIWRYRDLATARARIDESACASEVSPDQRYVAHVCRLGFYDVLRLRSMPDARLLAEKTYVYVDVPLLLLWKADQLQYMDGDNQRLAQIALPPSTIERFLARLP
jgi:hypothetical protein